MKRVLHITGAMYRAGAETAIMNLYRQLDRNKFQFDFLYFTEKKCDYDDEIKSLGGKIYNIKGKSNNKLIRVIKRYIDYYKLLKKLPNHQIIHSHINLNGALFLFLAFLQNKRLRIAHSHSSDRKMSKIEKIYYSINTNIIKISANIYLACGESAGKYLYPNIDSKKIILFSNTIDVEDFQKKYIFKDFLRIKLDIDENIKIVTQIGSLTSVKNHVLTIELANYLQKTNDNLHFVFVGTGPLDKKLKEIVREKNLLNKITFLGVSSEIPEILHSSDLLIMPSILEGFPMVLIEAQACGVPCLISNNISQEVDVVNGLITFLNLHESLKVWKEGLEHSLIKKSTDFESIKKILKTNKYDSIESVKVLQQIYK